jgi:hypothetical protein
VAGKTNVGQNLFDLEDSNLEAEIIFLIFV